MRQAKADSDDDEKENSVPGFEFAFAAGAANSCGATHQGPPGITA